jgi:hypothetical protein
MSSYHAGMLSEVPVLDGWGLITTRRTWGMWGSSSAGAMVRAAASSGGGYAAFGYLSEVSCGERWTRGSFAVISWALRV